MAAATPDAASIHSLVTQAVQEKLEVAVVCGVSNAMNDNDALTHSTASMSTGDESGCSVDSSKRKAQAGNVGVLLSRKKLNISLRPN